MAEVERLGFDEVLGKAINETLDGAKYLYVSIDVDVMDPAFAPGAGTPNPVASRHARFSPPSGAYVTKRQ